MPGIPPKLLSFYLQMSWLPSPKDLAPNSEQNKHFADDGRCCVVLHTNELPCQNSPVGGMWWKELKNWPTSFPGCSLSRKYFLEVERGPWERGWKLACNWLMMISYHCPNLVRIGCNANFLSRFPFTSIIIRISGGADRKEFKRMRNRGNMEI